MILVLTFRLAGGQCSTLTVGVPQAVCLEGLQVAHSWSQGISPVAVPEFCHVPWPQHTVLLTRNGEG